MPETPAPISLTERAARRIAQIVEAEKSPGARLRVSVVGGGCSGFQYSFSLDDKVQDDDIVVERDSAAMVIDNVSLMYLTNSELDFIEELAGSYFVMRNPNATASCGCGNSFAVAL